jgi:hypothetical protein
MLPLLSARVASKDQDPFRLLRLAAGGILLFATLVALLLWLTGVTPRAVLLLGAFWAIYGLVFGLLDGFLEPMTDLTVEILQNAGLMRYRTSYASVESLAARGLYDVAANEYLERSRRENGDAEALVRRAAILAGPLSNPGMAALELHNYRDTRQLRPADDIKIGLALVELYDRRLADPGRAMAELRRLIDLYPTVGGARQLRRTLNQFRREKFGAASEEDSTPP